MEKRILKTAEDLIQLCKCSQCLYLVKENDFNEDEEKCRFCNQDGGAK